MGDREEDGGLERLLEREGENHSWTGTWPQSQMACDLGPHVTSLGLSSPCKLVIPTTLSRSFHASLELHLKHIQVTAFTFHKGVSPANSTWPL